MSIRLATAALLLLTSISAVRADAVTYEGELAGKPIVLELSSDPAGSAAADLVGRYAYGSRGIDIPLHAVAASGKDLTLFEELPCTDALCEAAYMAGGYPDAIRGATWTLRLSDNGKTLSGTWKAPSGKKTLPITLELVGSRPYGPWDPTSVESLAELPVDASVPVPLYEALKLAAVAPTIVESVFWGKLAFRYVSDPRTRFRFPQVVDLGGSDPTQANAWLDQRRSYLALNALACESRDYFSLGWFPGSNVALDTLGGYPDEQIEVTYLSPRLIAWTESGSLFCGGAHPDNHSNGYALDIAAGLPLDLGKIFADWTRDEYGSAHPPQALIDYVTERRSTLADPDFDAECGIADLIPEYLGVRFEMDDRVTFTLEHLPHVIFACGEDLLTVPLSDLRPFLAPTAADYFTSLKQ